LFISGNRGTKGISCIVSYKLNRMLNINIYNFSAQATNFSSTSLSLLYVNSIPNNIVFIQGKSILFLTYLNLVRFICDNTRDLDCCFFSDLNIIFINLGEKGEGLYRFNFYFHIESSLPVNVFTFDLNNKNCLNKVNGTFGYFNIISITIKIERI